MLTRSAVHHQYPALHTVVEGTMEVVLHQLTDLEDGRQPALSHSSWPERLSDSSLAFGCMEHMNTHTATHTVSTTLPIHLSLRVRTKPYRYRVYAHSTALVGVTTTTTLHS